MKNLTLFLASALALTAILVPIEAGVSPCGVEGQSGRADLDVLMIGNSYTQGTYSYFQGFADADPAVNVHLGLAASGGKTLFWHWENRNLGVYQGESLVDKLTERAWDIVILQDLSTRASSAWLDLPGERFEFHTAIVELDALIASLAPTTEIRFFQTWARAYGAPYLSTYFDNDPLAMHAATMSAYSFMAQKIGAQVIPIGEAWLFALSLEDSAYSFLHSADLSHPSTAGSYLSGAVFYAFAFDRSPVGSPYTAGLSADMVSWLQEAAHTIWLLY